MFPRTNGNHPPKRKQANKQSHTHHSLLLVYTQRAAVPQEEWCDADGEERPEPGPGAPMYNRKEGGATMIAPQDVFLLNNLQVDDTTPLPRGGAIKFSTYQVALQGHESFAL